MRKLVLLGFAGALCFGCGDDDGRPDSGLRDTGPMVDTGPLPDTGPMTDTGPLPDTGPVVDGGGGGMCPAGACDLITNVGCEAGEGCYFVTTMEGVPPSPMCIAAGTIPEGGMCPNANDCQEGHVCILEDGPDNPGTCREVCCGGSTASCTNPGASCLGLAGADGAGYCSVPDGCGIIDQSGCEPSEMCIVVSGDGSSSCVPSAPGGGMQDAPCDDSPCAGGFLCLGPEGGPSFCRRACNPMDAMCPAETTCANITGFPATLGGCVPASG